MADNFSADNILTANNNQDHNINRRDSKQLPLLQIEDTSETSSSFMSALTAAINGNITSNLKKDTICPSIRTSLSPTSPNQNKRQRLSIINDGDFNNNQIINRPLSAAPVISLNGWNTTNKI